MQFRRSENDEQEIINAEKAKTADLKKLRKDFFSRSFRSHLEIW
jgi:hypothetical protein